MSLFGQELFEQAEKTKGLDDPAYKKARQVQLPGSGPERHRQAARRTIASSRWSGRPCRPAWKIDAVNGDQIAGGGAGSLAAVAGYPHLTVPMGLVKGLPVGLSFIGPEMVGEPAAQPRLCL